ncbi:keratinocyte-associated protein 3 [Rhinichthys klamathensis goyatoka]|uniref:keratinocyte-associated protein 3 n=1 Tax=Rhinichthys klamathensis goyatoka TaxID=3034132 RepID=UPI0024B4B11C|nr:keratinocyte-associated protein 3 [Rhinichthys klamathensis goyatoka]
MCDFDKQKGPGRLMKKGLTLIVIGHVNFILSAILHGSVLRHVSKPSNEISTEYTISNIISVSSGLLSIASGIVAILVSRNITYWKLHIGLLVSSFLNTLLTLACLLGLILAISLTISTDGSGLMKGCNSTNNARSPVIVDCPFDATRIYDTTLALWFTCAAFTSLEAGLSVWCFIVGLQLRGIGPCAQNYIREQLEEEALASASKMDQHHTTQGERLIAHQSASA